LEGRPKGEGKGLGKYWRWDTKVWGANRIRYPSSPNCKRWMLDIRVKLNVKDNSLSILPEYYGRKTKIQNN